ncbi:leukocyte receptor cluster member 8 [Anticarsia gemmatalis]|uniref:leukocyte receptor cluster member 8 n=1 Tax=Anticarsia gemmatalis TaxID=129554 RepID=UPI003F764E0B
MSDNTSKQPPLQTMNGMPPNHNPWLYGIYPQYNGYHGGMYPPYYNQYFNQMGNNSGFPNNTHQFHQNKDPKPDLSHPQFSKPPPTTPLLGMSPLDTNRPFFNQTPIRFNLNNIRKPAPLPLNENPLLSNNGPKKKRKKSNPNNKANEGDSELNDVLPPLPDHPPPLPPLPPPDIPKPPPPPPLDVPLPPPLATEDIPQPPEPEGHHDNKNYAESNENNNSSNFLKSASIPKNAGNWPEGLEKYIKRCYEKCKSAFDRDQIDICLKGRITAAANKDEIWTRNWDEEPIPSVHSERNNLAVKPVRGTLNLYQKPDNVIEPPKSKGLLNARGYVAHKNSPQRRRRPHSKSRSHSRSPVRKRLSASSASGDEVEEKKTPKGKARLKVKDRLSLDQKKPEKYQKGANKKKQSFEQFVVEDFQGNAEKLLKRAERFGNNISSVPSIASSVQGGNKRQEPTARRPIIQDVDGDYEINNMHIVGTCHDIEKSFLRLTRAPEACEVRPLSVLTSSLKNVKQKWIDNQDYRYACDQLKSIRQDLTVQGIRDGFTVEVYETHARIALEKGDHEEFNQCQTQLKMLYCELPNCAANISEFTAYRILYYIFTNNTLDIGTMCKVLPNVDEETDECMIHAMKTRHAWALGNMRSFFRLYKNAPKMAGYLMDWFVDRERKKYLKYIIKSYRQTVPVEFIVRELAFESSSKALEFLNQFSLSYTGDQSHIDCKASQLAVANL